MTRKLTVWGCSIGIYRKIVATRTKKEAAEALGMSMYMFNQYASDTGNQTEIELATSKPGTVFYKSNSIYSDPFKEKQPGEYLR